MKFEISKHGLDKISADGVVVFAFRNKKSFTGTGDYATIDKILKNALSEAMTSEQFGAEIGDVFTFHTHNKILASKVFVLGLGDKKECTENDLRRAMAIFTKMYKSKIASAALSLLTAEESGLNDRRKQARIIAEGILSGNYEFSKYKGEKKEKKLELIIFSEDNPDAKEKIFAGVKFAELLYSATKLARDLVNEPASVVTPTFLSDLAKSIAKGNSHITCKVFDKQDVKRMGMGAFLGVAQASDTPPKFIHIEYNPKAGKKGEKLAIVGKGITFDSGGISIKPADSMMTMKCDMSGAAAVLGVFSVISDMQPDISVMGLVAATPNLISGVSLVPGDVITAMNGKTIEVLNTDAEGRVTMADSIAYALKHGADTIIDLATLTGACMVALGTDTAALFGNNDEFSSRIEKAAAEAGESVWRLPLEKKYKQLNKSDVADIANIPSSRYGGAITAALFLEEFVANKPWVHLDIAGPAFYEKSRPDSEKGGTGFGVKTLLMYLKNRKA